MSTEEFRVLAATVLAGVMFLAAIYAVIRLGVAALEVPTGVTKCCCDCEDVDPMEDA